MEKLIMCYGFKVLPFEAWTTRLVRDFYAVKHVCRRRNTTPSWSRINCSIIWLISKLYLRTLRLGVLVVDSTVKV
jgi:hypothetical protein